MELGVDGKGSIEDGHNLLQGLVVVEEEVVGAGAVSTLNSDHDGVDGSHGGVVVNLGEDGDGGVHEVDVLLDDGALDLGTSASGGGREATRGSVDSGTDIDDGIPLAHTRWARALSGVVGASSSSTGALARAIPTAAIYEDADSLGVLLAVADNVIVAGLGLGEDRAGLTSGEGGADDLTSTGLSTASTGAVAVRPSSPGGDDAVRSGSLAGLGGLVPAAQGIKSAITHHGSEAGLVSADTVGRLALGLESASGRISTAARRGSAGRASLGV